MIIRAFEAQVEKSPDRLALKGEKESITYRELNRYANRVAYRIQKALPVDSSSEVETVGLLLDHGPRMIAAILGTLKAGKAYVPLAPDYPGKRIFYILTHSRAGLVITDTGYEKKIEKMLFENNVDIGVINLDTDIDGETDAVNEDVTGKNPYREIKGNKIAYIMYTSGSTGNPKGVMQTHENVMYYTRNWTRRFSITSSDRMTLFSSFCHDGSLQDMFGALHNGAVLYPYDMRNREAGTGLSDFLIKERITIWHSVPSLYSYFAGTLTDEEKFKDLRFILLGGEPVRQHEVNMLKKFFPFSTLANVYGQTESSVDSIQLISPRDSFEKTIIGEPLDETQIFVIDDGGNEVESLETGEIIVASRYISPGYWRDEETTRKMFRENPDLGRLYRTGDLGCLLLDGNIEFLGRKDWQVKIRGYRVELGEIESVLLQHDEIHEAVAAAFESENINGTGGAGEGPGDKYIAAYYVSGQTFEPSELREYLSRYLPDYMIPTYFVRLDAFPLTTSRKIDRKALPLPAAVSGTPYTAPRDKIEEKLVEIWAEVLKQSPSSIGIDDNFFNLGGHSLKAVLLVANIHKELHVRIPFSKIFAQPNIRRLAEYIRGAPEDKYASIEPVEQKEYYPLSSAQKRMFILQQMDITSTAYNMPVMIPIEGIIDKTGLEDIFRKLINRHESFRTSFEMVNGQPVQRIHDNVAFEVEYHDLTAAHFLRSFDLSRAPLLRVGLIHRHPPALANYILMVDMHHIISDGTSRQILTEDFMALYAAGEPKTKTKMGIGNGSKLNPLRLQYRDFSTWQNALFESRKIEKQVEYWVNLYSDEIPKLDLPANYRRPGIFNFAGGLYNFKMGGEDTRKLREFGKKTNTTIYMNMLALFNVLLHKYTGQTDIVVGCAAAGRPHADLQGVIGMFINMLPMRCFPGGGKRFIDFAGEAREHSIKAFENQDVQFEALIDQLNLDRDPSRNPLFDVSMVIQNFEIAGGAGSRGNAGSIRAGRDRGEAQEYEYEYRTAKFDMTLFVFEAGDEILLSLEYYKSIFEKETINRLSGHFLNVLHQAVENPLARVSEIEFMNEEEKQKIIYDFNETGPGYTGDKTLHELFEEQAAKAPDSVAVFGHGCMDAWRHEGVHITYRELNQKSDQVAHLIKEKGVLADSIIGIMMERFIEMIVGILGILKAGGAYMPIDPDYPQERIDYMLKDSGAKILLKNLSEADLHHSSNRFIDHHSGSLAYVIYTSGTTGRPKGTLTTHCNAVRVVKNTNYIDLKKDDRVLQLSNYAFDGSVFDIFGALSNGVALVLVEKEETFDIDRLSYVICREHITLFFVTTALFNTIADLDIGCLKNVRKILFGGERVSVEHARKALDYLGKGRIIHMYGPTETTVYASYYNIDAIEESAFTVPIGQPISHTALYILDEHLRPQPIGVKGEIYIGGDGLARGYLNQPELTAEKFRRTVISHLSFVISNKSFVNSHSSLVISSVNKRSKAANDSSSKLFTNDQCPMTNDRLYRTGDLARWLPGGDVEFLGRIDLQVKIRGFRVELGEIERLLLKHNNIKEAVVLFRGTGPDADDYYLCAYFVPVEKAPGKITNAELNEYLSRTLPNYMIPSYFVELDRIPLTANGKINARELPIPGIRAGTEYEYTAPLSEIEKKLAEIWTEVLGREGIDIGINDNFFDLGGHSLKAAVLAARIHKELNRKIPLAEIFRHPTIRELAVLLEEIEKTGFQAIECIEKKEFYQLSYNQKRLWFIHQLEPGTSAFNIPGSIVLREEVEEESCRKILRNLVERHESLRTGFKTLNGEPVQYIVEDVEEADSDIFFRVVDISQPASPGSTGRTETIQKRQEIYNEIAGTPFDLTEVPLFRLALVKSDSEFYELIFCMHHIISDGWSIELLKKEFSLLYDAYKKNKKIGLEPLELQYKDFADWQNRQVNSPVSRAEPHRYWKARLKEGITPLRLHGSNTANTADRKGAGYRCWINDHVKEQLKELAKNNNTSLFMVMYSIYILFLFRFSKQEDIACSIIDAGRDHISLQKVIGFFVNAVLAKTGVDETEPFDHFLERVHAGVMEVFQYQGYPLEPVFEDLRMRYPDINLSFNMVNVREFTVDIEAEPFESHHIPTVIDVKFDIEPYVSEYKNGIDLYWTYRKGMFTVETIEYIFKEYGKLLSFFAANPGKSFRDYMETSRQQRSILREAQGLKKSEENIARRFERQVEKNPDNIAVKTYENGEALIYTYDRLNRYANRIAHRIRREAGYHPGGDMDIVGLLLDHGVHMIAAILGTLKAGKAYVPLSPGYPDKRLLYMLTHSQAGLVITGTQHKTRIKNMVPGNNAGIPMIDLDMEIDAWDENEYEYDENPGLEIKGDKIAYIMYTSGSTGSPKGVVQIHKNVMYYTRNWTERFAITSADRMTLFSSFSHDGSLQDMFGALHKGAALYPYDMRNREESTGLSDFLIQERITIWHSVPSLYSYFAGTLTGEEKFEDLRFILLGGEPVRQHEVDMLKKFFPFSTLANVYGQTESSVDSIQLISPRDSFEKMIIGEPPDETQIFVIDDGGNEVEPLETGEIIVASRYVSPGYWRDEETTRKTFRENPDLGRLYYTGDLGCLLPDGNIEFLGRKDWQVKIRGYRVELGEIESVLLQHDEIHDAVAAAIESENINGTGGAGEGPGDKYIAAYYVSGRTFEPSELREYLSRYLPDYMIPTYFVRLDAFPLTTSRKIDRRALPLPTAVSERQYTAPRDEIEEKLVGIWAEVLKQSPSSIGIDDNFFDLGGHSLKAALLVAKVHQVLSARLPLVQIFKTPSIRELSRCIKEMHREQFFAVPRLEEKEYYDVSNAQQRVWIQSQEKQASLSFNMNGAYVIEADLDKHTVDNVFETLIRRHESLRTVFITVDELPKQKILPPDKTGFNVEHRDWRKLHEEEIQARTRELALSELNTPFDLSRGPLLRVKLLQVKEKTFIFLFTMHHIVSDALSMGVLFREVFLLYRYYRTGENKHNPLTPLRIHYRDYAAWQNEQLSGEELRRAKAYWLHRLGGALQLKRLQLPADKERPKILAYNGGAVYLNIAGPLTGQLKDLARRHGMTLFMVLTAAFKALLARYSGQTDIIIGTVAACREYAELENQVGYYLNTLTLRTAIDPADSFDMLLEKVKETILNAYEHQLYPFDRLVGDLGIPRETNRHPLFDVVIDMVNYQPAQAQETPGGSGMKVSPYGTGYNRSKFDLTLYAFEGKDLVGLKFEYSTDLFEHGTIQWMGERFLKLLKRMVAVRESGACLAGLLEEEDQEIALPQLEPLPGRGQDMEEGELKVPVSYHQERLWFIDTFETGNIYESAPVYHNVPLLLEITGDLDIPSLEKCIQAVIRRHEALRTRIITIDNRPVQWIREEQDVDFHLPVKDLTEEANPYSLEKAIKLAMEETQRPFSIEKDLLIRGLLIIPEKKRLYLLAITLHHMIADRSSLEILCRELFAPGLAEPLFQYIDFSQWQREFVSSPSFSSGILDTLMYYWRWQLRGKLQALELPTDHPRAPIHIYKSGWQPFTFPDPLTDKIHTFINREGISPFVFFLAVFKTLLHRYSNQEEIVVGTGMKNRGQPGSEHIVGPIANLVVLRSFLSQRTTFNNLLSQLKKTVDEAAKCQTAPFDLLVLKLKPEVDMSRTALFDVLFQYEEDTFQLPPMENLEVEVIETNLGWGKYDLNLLIQRKADRCTGVLVYNRYYHNAATISRFIGHFMVLTGGILSEPHRQLSEFNLLTEEEQHRLLIEWNQPRIDYPMDRTIHQLFEEQVEKTPDNVAVVGAHELHELHEGTKLLVQITYYELNEKSNRLAYLLREKGVLTDSIIGIMVERSIEMLVGILGILKAGGAYLPIDPESPQERIDFMLKDSSAKLLLTNLFEEHHNCRLSIVNYQLSMSSSGAHLHHSGNLAYIIYTSGTTGQPKGCLITHKNVISLLKNKIQPFDFNEWDVWTMFHRYNFDFSVWEMYGALLYGGKLIVIPRMVTRDPGQYLEILKQEKVTVLNQTPSAFYHLADAEVSQPDNRLYLRYVIFGGEALNPVRLKPWRVKYPDTKLINMFGITETTIHVTYKEIGDNEIETGTGNIGRPLSTLTAYVLDQNLNPVPIGVPGELCVGGEGVARGYLNHPQLTVEKFINKKFLRGPGAVFLKRAPGRRRQKIYRSGDLVKLLENGDMEYLGRIDHQVKIRGFRIELGEIETQLLKHKGVKEAVVLSRRDKSGNPYLCAYLVPSRMDADAGGTELRKHLSRVLPDYMIPSYFVQLAKIPLTANGKVDRSALPEPEEYRLNLQQTYVAPENEREEKIAEIWQEVLQLDRVGTRDNFFEIGGDSLKTIQLKSKLEETLNRTIPVVVLFERMTIRSFGEYLTELEKNEAGLGPEKKIDRSEAISRAKDSREKRRIKRKVRSQNVEE